ncbi:hypothetical protein Rrhod_2721 [Rhodococcus rhodnii LMG 5362]|uniref:RDD domain-containing protein n=2 Tax=Rhodococcus rhodnii TaxID=38312 RepID=R7WKZ3_9NOCA|nr:hypothetical protein Rrhod_2721 [Rhodococcus rhodnii LMG 5362]
MRRRLAFLVDWLLHIGVFFGLLIGLLPAHLATKTLFGIALLAWIAVSFLHRVVVQSIWRTTLGKRLFDLEMVRPDDGGRPDFKFLATWWGIGLVAAITSFSGPKPIVGEVMRRYPRFPCAVRTRDIKSRARALGLDG